MHIDEIRERLRINKGRLDEELEVNSSISDLIAQQVATLRRGLATLKKDLEITESRAVAVLKRDDPKMTNPQAERAALTDPYYEKAWERYQNALQVFEEWEGLQKAWYQRSFDLKALGELYGHEYFTLTSIQGPDSGQQFIDRLRAGIREASARVNSKETTRPRRRLE